MIKDTPLIIGNKTINNRFFLGTGKFKSNQDMKDSILSSGSEVVTVAMRRVDAEVQQESIIEYVPKSTILMINTSGARNSEEAIEIARLAKEAMGIDWIKIEIMDDSKYLLPDNRATIKATEVLASEGFTVLPYMNPDLYDARALLKAGAAAIMPLGSLIGSGEGLLTKRFIKILIDEIDLPIIVDAGIGAPSQAAEAMEIGAAAVLANTAVAVADDSPLIAEAFSLAVKAGRLAFLGKLSGYEQGADASSPLTGFLFEN